MKCTRVAAWLCLAILGTANIVGAADDGQTDAAVGRAMLPLPYFDILNQTDLFQSVTASRDYEYGYEYRAPQGRFGYAEITEIWTNTQAQPIATSAPDATAEAQPSATPAPEANAEAQPSATPAPDATVEAQPSDTPAPEANVEAQPSATPTSEANVEVQPSATPAPEATAEAQPSATPAPEANVEAQPSATPAPEVYTEAQPSATPVPEANAEAQPSATPAPEANAEAQTSDMPAPEVNTATQPESDQDIQFESSENPLDEIDIERRSDSDGAAEGDYTHEYQYLYPRQKYGYTEGNDETTAVNATNNQSDSSTDDDYARWKAEQKKEVGRLVLQILGGRAFQSVDGFRTAYCYILRQIAP